MSRRKIILLAFSLILGLVFISAGMGKALGQSGFLLNLTGTMPPWLRVLTIDVLPWVELAVGLALVAGVMMAPSAMIVTVMCAVFMFHNIWMITHGYAYEPCSCFGAFEIIFKGALSSLTALYVDIGLFVMAVAVYFLYRGVFFNWRPWYLDRNYNAMAVEPVADDNPPPGD